MHTCPGKAAANKPHLYPSLSIRHVEAVTVLSSGVLVGAVYMDHSIRRAEQQSLLPFCSPISFLLVIWAARAARRTTHAHTPQILSAFFCCFALCCWLGSCQSSIDTQMNKAALLAAALSCSSLKMVIPAVAAACVLVLLFPLIYHWFSLRGMRLPPGSMGWPYLGETLKLYSQNPDVFFSSKQRRYGEIFKTHILGCPSVMIASPEAAKFILVSHAHLFKTTFPSSKEGIIGPHALFFHEGDYHRRLRRLVQSCFVPEAIRGLVSEVEALALQALESWEGQTINTFQEMKKYAFDVGVLQIFGRQEGLDRGDLKRAYQALERGYNSFPIDIAGTPYNAAMKARKHLSSIVSQIITERRKLKQQENQPYKDLLTTLMESQDASCKKLTDEQIGDNVIGVIFAAQDTTACVLTWLLKYLKENPLLLEAVQAEQQNIRKLKTSALTWADTKNMPLTSRVIQETLRLATILSFTFREAVEDVQYKDYVIPKGWKVMPLFRSLHHSPDYFPNPQKFDPSRFEAPIKPNTFMPFGSGVHSCPGNELAKLEMLVLVHHLTTKFRWDFAGPTEGVQYGPFPMPKGGLPIVITRQ